MEIINRSCFAAATAKYPKHARAIKTLEKALEGLSPRSSSELKSLIGSLKRYPGLKHGYKMDVGGRKGLRLICTILFKMQQIDIHYLGDHAGYDKFEPGKQQ